MRLEFKGTKGDLSIHECQNRDLAIKAEGKGFIAFFPKPRKYSDQEKRYEEDIAEYNANINLFLASRELLKACKMARIEIAKGTADTLTVDVLEKAISKALKLNQ